MDLEAPVAESLVEFSYWHAIFIIGAVVTYFVDLVFGKSTNFLKKITYVKTFDKILLKIRYLQRPQSIDYIF